MMRFIERVVVDEWEIDLAMEEAPALGLRPESRLREFALEYVAARTG